MLSSYRDSSEKHEVIYLPSEADLHDVIIQADNPSSIIMAAFHALDDTVGGVLQGILSRTDQVSEHIVSPLLRVTGPLGDIKVRTALLLGLGVISREIYSDLEVFIRLKEFCIEVDNRLSFIDTYVLSELRSIEVIRRITIIDYDSSLLSGLSENMKKMFVERHNQKVRSAILLAITELVEQLNQGRKCAIS